MLESTSSISKTKLFQMKRLPRIGPKRRRGEFVLLFIAFLLLLISLFRSSIVGFISKTVGIYLSASKVSKGLMFVSVNPSSVYSADTITIFTEFTNIGNTNISEYTEVEVVSSNGTTYFLISSPSKFLTPNSRNTFTFALYVLYPPGDYKVVARGYYDGKMEKNTASFRVLSVPKPPPPPPPGPPPPPSPVPNISLEYPEEMNLTEGINYTFLVKVENVGNILIHNLTLHLESEGIISRVVYPVAIPSLDVGDSAFFVCEIMVPLNISEGLYEINLTLYSSELIKKGQIKVFVKVSRERGMCEDVIEYYSNLLKTLEDETKKAEAEGYNVSTIKPLLDDVRYEINSAKELYNLGFFSECVAKQTSIRDKIRRVAEELARIKMIVKVKLPAFVWWPYMFLVILALIIVIVVLILMLVRRRRRPIMRFRRLEFRRLRF